MALMMVLGRDMVPEPDEWLETVPCGCDTCEEASKKDDVDDCCDSAVIGREEGFL